MTRNENSQPPCGRSAASLESLGVSTSEPVLVALGLESVLTEFVPEERVVALAEASGVEIGVVKALLPGPDTAPFPDLWAGRLPLDEMLTWLRAGLDADLTEAHLMGLWSLAYEPHPKGLRLASDLGYDPGVHAVVALATEAPLYSAGAEAYLPEVGQVVSETHCTWRVGLPRCEPDFYRRVAEAQGMAAPQCWLVDGAERHRTAAIDARWGAVKPPF